MNKVVLSLILIAAFAVSSDGMGRVDPYVNTIEEKGVRPVEFVLDKLDQHDLIIFDDGLHTAVSPFDFYERLISDSDFQKKVKYIFIEVVAVNQQSALDMYLDSEEEDRSLLFPAFQNDFSGKGWPYQTYFDLMLAIRNVNLNIPAEDRFRVIAVNAPVYWELINTPADLDLFRLSLSGNDYTMYRIILSYLKGFKSKEKGIFLTNTRHAYRGIKNSEGKYYWNCGTFFHQHQPGKAYSVRMHNIALSFQRKKEYDPDVPKSTEGLERLVVNWVRMEKGLWDSAFRETGDRPVGFDIKGTPFGNAPYIGNHMLDAAGGQTISDAYDGLIFLVPLERTRRTGIVDYIYTDEFRIELERRLGILYTDKQLKQILKEKGYSSKAEYIEGEFIEEQEKPQPLLKDLGRIDEWKFQ